MAYGGAAVNIVETILLSGHGPTGPNFERIVCPKYVS
jgi:hypothetical protein